MQSISTINILNMNTYSQVPFVSKASDMIILARSKKTDKINDHIKSMHNRRYLMQAYDYRYNISQTVYKIIDCVDNSVLYYCVEDIAGNQTIKINRIYWLNEIANLKDKLKYYATIYKKLS